MDAFWEAASPAILTMIEALIALLLAFISAKLPTALRRWFDKHHRETLHSAMTTGAKRALAGDLDADEAVEAVLRYVSTSAGDAIKHFAPTPDKLHDMAKGYLSDLWEQRHRIGG